MSDAAEEQTEAYDPFDSKTFPKASDVRGVASLSKDDLNLKNCAFQRTKGINRMWAVAEACPLFRKPSGVDKNDKKKKKKKGAATTRINRVLNSHTITTLASGAAGNAAALLYGETQVMRLDTVADWYDFRDADGHRRCYDSDSIKELSFLPRSVRPPPPRRDARPRLSEERAARRSVLESRRSSPL